MLSQNTCILLKKLHSMRETPQTNILEKTTRYTCYHVKMSLTRGQYAWFCTQTKQNHQRLNVEKHSTLDSQKITKLDMTHLTPHSKDFNSLWLVGLTDGDGTFAIDRQQRSTGEIRWNLVYKISLSNYNSRALIKAKKILGAGKITSTPDGMSSLRIRNRQHLKRFVFPVFEKYSLLSSKYYDFIKVRDAARLLDDNTLSSTQRQQQLEIIYSQKTSPTMVAPIWSSVLDVENLHISENNVLNFFCLKPRFKEPKSDVSNIVTLPWLSGFIEAEGSFYIVLKDKNTNRYCHAFGITQKGNVVLMEAIRAFLKIPSQLKKKNQVHIIETTNWRNVESLKHLLSGKLIGIKSQEFRVWERSMKFRHNSEKLGSIQALMRRMRKRDGDRANFSHMENIKDCSTINKSEKNV